MPSYQYALMPEEIENFESFREEHKSCDPELRTIMIEEDCAPILTSIKLQMSSIGMCPTACCEVCSATESIGCEKRFNLL